MKLLIKAFGPALPILEPHLLPDLACQIAENVDLSSGSLDPLETALAVVTPAKVGTKKTIYRFGKDITNDTQYWFHWLNDTDVVRGPIATDTSERTYFTEAGQVPKVTDATIALASAQMPHTSYTLGLPSGTAALIAMTGTQGTDTPQKIALVYCHVSDWGEEGPPSTVSNQVDAYVGQTLGVSLMEALPAGAVNSTGRKRLYVAVTAGQVTAYKFWQEITSGTTASGVLDLTTLGEPLADPYLMAPPTNLFGLLAHPNQFLIGFSGKKVCRSEVAQPHGWPIEYQEPIDWEPVGGAISGDVTIILTAVRPVMMFASDPAAVQFKNLELRQGCVSKRSISPVDGGVVYASPDGAVMVEATGASKILTGEVFTRDQWQAYVPSSMHGYYHDGQYIVFYDTGSAQGMLMLPLDGSGVIEVTGFYATAGYVDHRRDALFLQVGDDIVKWKAGASRRTLRWRSKEYVYEDPWCPAAAKVKASGYPVTFKLYADGSLKHTQTVDDASAFTMPSDYTAYKIVLEVSGVHKITEIRVASSIAELAA